MGKSLSVQPAVRTARTIVPPRRPGGRGLGAAPRQPPGAMQRAGVVRFGEGESHGR
jgi:hypothetical protein